MQLVASITTRLLNDNENKYVRLIIDAIVITQYTLVNINQSGVSKLVYHKATSSIGNIKLATKRSYVNKGSGHSPILNSRNSNSYHYMNTKEHLHQNITTGPEY